MSRPCPRWGVEELTLGSSVFWMQALENHAVSCHDPKTSECASYTISIPAGGEILFSHFPVRRSRELGGPRCHLTAEQMQGYIIQINLETLEK